MAGLTISLLYVNFQPHTFVIVPKHPMPQHKLRKAPLQEVIFELFWKLSNDESGFPVDPGLVRAVGKFENQIADSFPVFKRTIPEGAPVRIYPKPLFQFWRDELVWPVVQLGPGILAVNDTEANYVWKDNYRNIVLRSVQALRESYPDALDIERVKLQYIDVVEFDPNSEPPQSFVERNLGITVKNNRFDVPGASKGLHVMQSYQLEDNSKLVLEVQTGIHHKTGGPAIIWITSIENVGNINFENLDAWLDSAHTICSDTFVNMLNPEFHASFDAP